MKLKELEKELRLIMKKKFNKKLVDEYLKRADNMEQEIDFWKGMSKKEFNKWSKLIAPLVVEELNKLRSLLPSKPTE